MHYWKLHQVNPFKRTKAFEVRDSLVPFAVRWYTGEACPDDGYDDDVGYPKNGVKKQYTRCYWRNAPAYKGNSTSYTTALQVQKTNTLFKPKPQEERIVFQP